MMFHPASFFLAVSLLASSAQAGTRGICDDPSQSPWPAFITKLCSVSSPEFKARCAGAPKKITKNDFRAEDVFNLVVCNHLTTIEQVMDRLPEDFLGRYTLVYSSGSQHFTSTTTLPRIVFYTQDAKLLMGIAGDASVSNGLELEMIQAKEKNARVAGFEMKAIQFKEDGVSRADILPNPTECARCHRSPRSPNWTAYPIWPGIYGSGVLGGKETKGFDEFIKGNALKGRYTRLVGLAGSKTYDFDFRNHDLSQKLGELNAERMAFWINSHPARAKVRYALAGAAAKCANMTEFLPNDLAASVGESFEDYSAFVMADVERRYQGMQDRAMTLAGDGYQFKTDAPFAFEAKEFLGIGYVMKVLLDLDPETFRLANTGSIYESHHTIGGMGYQFQDYDLFNTDCGVLAAKSRAALAGLKLALKLTD